MSIRNDLRATYVESTFLEINKRAYYQKGEKKQIENKLPCMYGFIEYFYPITVIASKCKFSA
jgi:hypothetical protein